MATMYNVFFGAIYVAVWLFVGLSDRPLNASSASVSVELDITTLEDEQATQRQKIVQIAARELGVRERTGNNDGERVEAYLRYTGFGSGYAWCAAFVSWCYGAAGKVQPRNAWSPALFPRARRYRISEQVSPDKRLPLRQPKPADVFGIYSASMRRINHVGLVRRVEGRYLITIEGNVDNAVLSKRRALRSIYTFADWLKL